MQKLKPKLVDTSPSNYHTWAKFHAAPRRNCSSSLTNIFQTSNYTSTTQANSCTISISKTPKNHLRRSNAVYRLNYSCGSFYVGQTRRNLNKRLEADETSETSEVCDNIQSNTHHKVDFNNPQSLTHFPR